MDTRFYTTRNRDTNFYTLRHRQRDTGKVKTITVQESAARKKPQGPAP